MDYEWELYKNKLLRVIKVKSHLYDIIEFSIRSNLVDENGKVIINNAQSYFFDKKEFVEFFLPIVDTLNHEMKAMKDEQDTSKSNT